MRTEGAEESQEPAKSQSGRHSRDQGGTAGTKGCPAELQDHLVNLDEGELQRASQAGFRTTVRMRSISEPSYQRPTVSVRRTAFLSSLRHTLGPGFPGFVSGIGLIQSLRKKKHNRVRLVQNWSGLPADTGTFQRLASFCSSNNFCGWHRPGSRCSDAAKRGKIGS